MGGYHGNGYHCRNIRLKQWSYPIQSRLASIFALHPAACAFQLLLSRIDAEYLSIIDAMIVAQGITA